ncbi:AraC family transcriptional regulator [Mesorhizobium tianshanense]|uniref:Helix-turn-helix protein n=1 Tax=Mesorhizobium tianshanense TaxID=39844 RepID=A0A562MTF4_9HYPH|nr:AraC family ligand binding domain-containing protein [Mesorhizobium tianshanense]TWI23156.1 helix-turn-helix protein [Mesorhizobium tianshanense]GLS34465.1 AraC family transcriptional regulator [Mesorhizobium tianshanense]
MHATETRTYWRHPCFPDLGLFKARFTQHRYELHTHPTYVIALITAGCERIRIGRQTVVAPAGTVAVVNPEEWHDGEQGADEGWAYRTFYPSVPLMTAVGRELGQDRAPVFSRAIIQDSDLAAALAAAHEGSTSRDATKAEASLLVALRRLIVRHGDWSRQAEEVESSGSRQRFSLYEHLVESGLGSQLDLQRLADAARVTRFQVIRDFKRAIGLTPAAYIRDRRLRRASFLIEQGLGLADAAIAAGFADQSHLSRTFRATRGMTPGMFRRGG